MSEDRYRAPVPDSAWAADEAARARGRVEIFNATRPGGLDGWTMDLTQYELVRDALLAFVTDHAGPDGSASLKDATAHVQHLLGEHPAFPGGRLTNYVRYTKVDLEARGQLARVPGSGPQRIRPTRDAGWSEPDPGRGGPDHDHQRVAVTDCPDP